MATMDLTSFCLLNTSLNKCQGSLYYILKLKKMDKNESRTDHGRSKRHGQQTNVRWKRNYKMGMKLVLSHCIMSVYTPVTPRLRKDKKLLL